LVAGVAAGCDELVGGAGVPFGVGEDESGDVGDVAEIDHRLSPPRRCWDRAFSEVLVSIGISSSSCYHI
jgi:hypothetical protein